MSWVIISRTLSVGAIVGAAALLEASVIYDNFGAGADTGYSPPLGYNNDYGYVTGYGWELCGVGFEGYVSSIAVPFNTGSFQGSLDSIELPIFWRYSPSDFVELRVLPTIPGSYSSAEPLGLPDGDNPMGGWCGTVANMPQFVGLQTAVPESIAVSSVNLHANTQYWIWATPGDPTSMWSNSNSIRDFWCTTDSSNGAGSFMTYGGSEYPSKWGYPEGGQLPALRLDGTAAVPEPFTSLTLGGGVLALAIRRRRG